MASGIEHPEGCSHWLSETNLGSVLINKLFIDEVLGLHKTIEMHLKFILGVFQ